MDDRILRLEEKALEVRKATLEMCIKAKTGHVSSCMSCTEILVALYYGDIMRVDPKNPDWKGRDRFILSKGQASPALYTVLADLGFYDKKELDKFAQKDGIFGVHLQHDVPGVEITAGALGHGLGVAAGLALGAKMSMEPHLTFCLLGDGELYEGSNWETAMFASTNKLNNLISIIDRNYQCTTGFTEDLVELEPLEEKWESFGFDVVRIDGHSMDDLLDVLDGVRSRASTAPLMIIADTVKGKGINTIENMPGWHGLAPTNDDDIARFRADLERISC